MSTQVAEIIVQSFREGNFIPVGQTTTAEELVEAVPRLNSFLRSLLGIELGEQYRDWYVPSVWDPAAPLRFPLTPSGDGAVSAEPWAYPPANVRLITRITADKTLFFPAFPSDGARMAYVDVGSSGTITLSGNGRLIEGKQSLSGLPADGDIIPELSGRKWLYRADLGNWIRLQTLGPDDEVPLPEEFDDLLVTGLVIRLAPRFGVEIHESVVARHGDMLDRLKKRYKQSEKIPSSAELRQVFREI